MFWRKWLVRTLVLLLTAGLGGAATLYLHWTSPATIRRQVVSKLSEQLPGAVVSLDSARLRLLGGIALKELRLSRRDDAERTEFAQVPSAILYHDKEQLLDGKLAIRKIVLERPRIWVIRDRLGRWNMENLVGKGDPDAAMPTIVVQHGTLILEDRSVTPVITSEIRDVELTLVNDPLPEVDCHGTGRAELAGPIDIQAHWKRDSGSITLQFKAPEVRVQAPFWSTLSPYLPAEGSHLRNLSGRASLQADLGFQPGKGKSWSHDVRLTLSRGSLPASATCMPVPLENIEASLRCLNGEFRVESCSAVSGQSLVELTGWVRNLPVVGSSGTLICQQPTSPGPAQYDCNFSDVLPRDVELDMNLKIKHLAIDARLLTRLPGVIQKINAEYAPRGPIDLSLQLSRQDGQCKQRLVIEPRDLTASFWRFPYPVEHFTGSLTLDLDTCAQQEHMKLELMGYAGAAKVFVDGTVLNSTEGSKVDVKIWGDNLPMDDRLVQALPEGDRELARKFHPTGLLDFQTLVRKEVGQDFKNSYHIKFHDAAIRFDEFPFPLENVEARLDVYPERWEFRDFVGRHNGAEIQAYGQSPPGLTDRSTLFISGTNVPLDREMAEAIKEPELRNAWSTFTPSGRMNFQSRVEIIPDKPPDVDVTLTALGCSIQPSFFPYRLDSITGTVRYAQRWVHAQKVQARHGQTVLSINEGKAYLKPNGGVWVDLSYLRGSPLIVDEPLMTALPPVLERSCRGLGVRGPVDLKTHVTIDSDPRLGEWPIVFWDGELGVRNSAFDVGVPLTDVTGRAACRGRYNGQQLEGLVGNVLIEQLTLYKQPFRNVQSQIEVSKKDPDVLVLPGIRAELFGGQVYGPARIEFGSRVRYELNLTASQVQLEEFGKQNLPAGLPLSGLASAQVYLTGQGSDLASLSGRGSIDVPSGRIYNLPVLLDLLKFLGLRLPDGTAFEEAHSNFTIRGADVLFQRIDLYGNSISLRGQGEMKLDGSDLNLEFYAVWARIVQLLPPIIKDIPPTLSKYLLKIRMRGKVGDVKLSKEPVPILVDPLRDFLDTLPGRRNRTNPQQGARR